MGKTYGLAAFLEGVQFRQQTALSDHCSQRRKRWSATINGPVRGSHRCRPPRCQLQWTTARWAAQRMSGTRIFERRHKSLPNNFVVPFIDPKEKKVTRYHQSSHECFIGTNGEPVAADIFYHPLPFHELTSIATNRVLTSGIVLVSPSPLMDNYPSIMCANLRNVLYPVS